MNCPSLTVSAIVVQLILLLLSVIWQLAVLVLYFDKLEFKSYNLVTYSLVGISIIVGCVQWKIFSRKLRQMKLTIQLKPQQQIDSDKYSKHIIQSFSDYVCFAECQEYHICYCCCDLRWLFQLIPLMIQLCRCCCCLQCWDADDSGKPSCLYRCGDKDKRVVTPIITMMTMLVSMAWTETYLAIVVPYVYFMLCLYLIILQWNLFLTEKAWIANEKYGDNNNNNNIGKNTYVHVSGVCDETVDKQLIVNSNDDSNYNEKLLSRDELENKENKENKENNEMDNFAISVCCYRCKVNPNAFHSAFCILFIGKFMLIFAVFGVSYLFAVAMILLLNGHARSVLSQIFAVIVLYFFCRFVAFFYFLTIKIIYADLVIYNTYPFGNNELRNFSKDKLENINKDNDDNNENNENSINTDVENSRKNLQMKLVALGVQATQHKKVFANMLQNKFGVKFALFIIGINAVVTLLFSFVLLVLSDEFKHCMQFDVWSIDLVIVFPSTYIISVKGSCGIKLLSIFVSIVIIIIIMYNYFIDNYIKKQNRLKTSQGKLVYFVWAFKDEHVRAIILLKFGYFLIKPQIIASLNETTTFDFIASIIFQCLMLVTIILMAYVTFNKKYKLLRNVDMINSRHGDSIDVYTYVNVNINGKLLIRSYLMTYILSMIAMYTIYIVVIMLAWNKNTIIDSKWPKIVYPQCCWILFIKLYHNEISNIIDLLDTVFNTNNNVNLDIDINHAKSRLNTHLSRLLVMQLFVWITSLCAITTYVCYCISGTVNDIIGVMVWQTIIGVCVCLSVSIGIFSVLRQTFISI